MDISKENISRILKNSSNETFLARKKAKLDENKQKYIVQNLTVTELRKSYKIADRVFASKTKSKLLRRQRRYCFWNL